MVWGLFGAPSVTVTVPVLEPALPGVNVTEIVQLAPAARLDPQVLVSPNPLDAVIFVILSEALPVFVSVTFWAALVMFTTCVAKVTLVVENEAWPCRPVPVRLTD